MKVRIKSGECPSYLTVGKVYDYDIEYFEIEADDGFNIIVVLAECDHLNGGSWEVVDE